MQGLYDPTTSLLVGMISGDGVEYPQTFTPGVVSGVVLSRVLGLKNTAGVLAGFLASREHTFGFGQGSLRFASPNNYINTGGTVAAQSGYTSVRGRYPVWLGSGALSQLVLSFCGWSINGGSINANGNDYTITKVAIEVDGVNTYAPVTFSGSRSAVVTNGMIELQSDPILPSAFSMANFPRGAKIWIRFEYAVASAGLNFPVGRFGYSDQGTATTVSIGITTGAVVSGVDAYGPIVFTSGWTNSYPTAYLPIVLGRFVSGDPKTIAGIGDSIVYGVGDTLTGYMQSGAFTQALFSTDHLSSPIAGCNFGYSGSTAGLWSTTNSNFLVNYLKYAKYAVDEFQTNQLANNGGLASAKTQEQTLWGLLSANGITNVVRTKLLPRTLSTDGTLPYSSSWAAGGDARLFNDWLDTPSLGAASGVTLQIAQMNGLRAGTTQSTDAFYQWAGATSGTLGANTGDGTHPSAAGHLLMAADYRTAFAALA